MTSLRHLILFTLLFPSTPIHAQTPPSAQESSMPHHHAHGSFDVNVKPLGPAPMPGVSRFSIDKTIHGDLEAATQGEMFTAGDPTSGHAGYVAIETVTGTLAGRHGSFVLQHLATMDANGPHMTVQIVPGSGTADLKGISGTFAITIADGKHTYELTYDLPDRSKEPLPELQK